MYIIKNKLASHGKISKWARHRGATLLKWSTHRDSIYPLRGGSEDGRQARQAGRDRSETAPSRGASRPRRVDSRCSPLDRRNAADVYRWRKQYGGMGRDQLRRLKELEKENLRRRRAVQAWRWTRISSRKLHRETIEPRASPALYQSCSGAAWHLGAPSLPHTWPVSFNATPASVTSCSTAKSSKCSRG